MSAPLFARVRTLTPSGPRDTCFREVDSRTDPDAAVREALPDGNIRTKPEDRVAVNLPEQPNASAIVCADRGLQMASRWRVDALEARQRYSAPRQTCRRNKAMNLYPPPAALAAVVFLAALAILVICEECWRSTSRPQERPPLMPSENGWEPARLGAPVSALAPIRRRGARIRREARPRTDPHVDRTTPGSSRTWMATPSTPRSTSDSTSPISRPFGSTVSTPPKCPPRQGKTCAFRCRLVPHQLPGRQVSAADGEGPERDSSVTWGSSCRPRGRRTSTPTSSQPVTR